MSFGENELAWRVFELSGQNVFSCYQCGKCSAGCPIVEEMDILPSQVIRLVQLGEKDVVNSETVWLCASCFTCTVRCPVDLDVAKVMESLRLIRLRKGIGRLKASEIEEMDVLPQLAVVGALRKLAE